MKDDVETPYEGDEQMTQADQNAYKMADTAASNDAFNNQVQKENFATQVGNGGEYAEMDFERQ